MLNLPETVLVSQTVSVSLLTTMMMMMCRSLSWRNVIVNSQDSDDNDVDDGPEENCPTPSVSEAPKASEVLNIFVHSNFDDDTMKSIMSLLPNAVRSYYRNKNQKQSKIADFLH
ncbi:hypothetical protein HHI36_016756 [Cryptolaemus montrouzieri]|uniref:Uncharacterized protein n=1 Tax=Cryptolaemus montrouzieri TaxID=559131 RepID=A0ABD2NKQ2_9CUCU